MHAFREFFSDLRASYETALDLAAALPFIHWSIGCLVTVVWMWLGNPDYSDQLLHHRPGLLCVVVLGAGFVFGMVSRLLMGLCPWPYAALARSLGIEPPTYPAVRD